MFARAAPPLPFANCPFAAPPLRTRPLRSTCFHPFPEGGAFLTGLNAPLVRGQNTVRFGRICIFKSVRIAPLQTGSKSRAFKFVEVAHRPPPAHRLSADSTHPGPWKHSLGNTVRGTAPSIQLMGLSLGLSAHGGCGHNLDRLIQEEIRMHDSDDVELTMLALAEGMNSSFSRTTASPASHSPIHNKGRRRDLRRPLCDKSSGRKCDS